MKVIVAGSRNIVDMSALERAILKSGFVISEIVSGGARGVDTLAITYAKQHNIPVKVFYADWKRHGRTAGAIRNGQMADYADALIALWDGQSRGTKNMIDKAKRLGLKIYVEIVS